MQRAITTRQHLQQLQNNIYRNEHPIQSNVCPTLWLYSKIEQHKCQTFLSRCTDKCYQRRTFKTEIHHSWVQEPIGTRAGVVFKNNVCKYCTKTKPFSHSLAYSLQIHTDLGIWMIQSLTLSWSVFMSEVHPAATCATKQTKLRTLNSACTLQLWWYMVLFK